MEPFYVSTSADGVAPAGTAKLIQPLRHLLGPSGANGRAGFFAAVRDIGSVARLVKRSVKKYGSTAVSFGVCELVHT